MALHKIKISDIINKLNDREYYSVLLKIEQFLAEFKEKFNDNFNELLEEEIVYNIIKMNKFRGKIVNVVYIFRDSNFSTDRKLHASLRKSLCAIFIVLYREVVHLLVCMEKLLYIKYHNKDIVDEFKLHYSQDEIFMNYLNKMYEWSRCCYICNIAYDTMIYNDMKNVKINLNDKGYKLDPTYFDYIITKNEHSVIKKELNPTVNTFIEESLLLSKLKKLKSIYLKKKLEYISSELIFRLDEEVEIYEEKILSKIQLNKLISNSYKKIAQAELLFMKFEKLVK